MKHDQDRDVIGRIARGDESALAELYHSHAQVLYNFAVRILGSADGAAEAVSDLFLSTWSGVAGMSGVRGPVGPDLVSRMREMLLSPPCEPGEQRPARDVDLWALVSNGSSGPADAEAAKSCPNGSLPPAILREILDRCGPVSTGVLSLVYFGGYAIPDAAARFSMTPAECRSRLHECLELLAAGKAGRRGTRAHHGRYSVCSAAWVLGAITPDEEPAYFDHLGGGCHECAAEIARFKSAAHSLPALLPPVKLPPELLDKILFSLRLAQIAGSLPARAGRDEERDRAAAGTPAAAPGSAVPAPAPHRRDRGRRIAVLCVVVAAIAAIAFLGIREHRLLRKLDAQSEILEALQERHTDLLLKYDRLAWISGYFESRGVVTALRGTGPYPRLTGRIVWDTTGGSAMLQILDAPGDLQDGILRVSAVRDEESVPIVEFRGDPRDSGGVFYRFFPVDVGPDFLAEGFTVDAAIDGSDDAGSYREIMSGAIPGRQ